MGNGLQDNSIRKETLMLYDLEKLRLHVEGRVSPARYEHSLAVQKMAIQLAKRYGADWYKAGVAGLLHDVCKSTDDGETLNYLRACGILPDILTLENPGVWHAIAAAEYVQEVLGVSDGEIISAIRWHATAREDMTTLEKVIYVADLISEDRDFDDAPMLRKMAENSLEAVLRYSLGWIIRQVTNRGKPIIQETWEAYNYYVLEEER
jgi:nicotinate-nucleotide adenylyltransferase